MINWMTEILFTVGIGLVAVLATFVGVRTANRFVDRQLMVKELRVDADKPIVLGRNKSARAAG
jgi:hypothetical protein